MKVPESFSMYVLDKDYVTVERLVKDLMLKEVTVRNYLSRMKQEGLIERVGRGRYMIVQGAVSIPDVPPGLQEVLTVIARSFPDLGPVAWSVSMISEYTHNVPGRDLYVVDAPRHLAAQLSEFLFDRDILVFLDSRSERIDSYAWSNLNPVFLFGRGETIASMPVDGYRIALVDRIWVDLYYLCTRRDLPFPLAELGVVLVNAFRDGAISTDRMLKYSSRRGLRTEVLLILSGIDRESDGISMMDGIIPHGRKAFQWIDEVVIGGQEGW